MLLRLAAVLPTLLTCFVHGYDTEKYRSIIRRIKGKKETIYYNDDQGDYPDTTIVAKGMGGKKDGYYGDITPTYTPPIITHTPVITHTNPPIISDFLPMGSGKKFNGDGDGGGVGKRGGGKKFGGKKGIIVDPPPLPPPTPPSSAPSRSADVECASASDCQMGEVCETGTCVEDGPLRFSLVWQGDDNLLLAVFDENDDAELFARNVTGSALNADTYVESVAFSQNQTVSGLLFIVLACQLEAGDELDDPFTVKVFENQIPRAEFSGIYRNGDRPFPIPGDDDDDDDDNEDDDIFGPDEEPNCQAFAYQVT